MDAKKNKNLKAEKGIAVIETVLMVFVFTTLIGFTIGFYGVSQRMILHSIASRAYGFEQIRHRANITYLRDVRPEGAATSYHVTRLRYFTVREPGSGSNFVAGKLPVMFGDRQPNVQASPEDHNSTAYENISRERRNDRHYFDSVWIKVGHGICLTVECGD